MKDKIITFDAVSKEFILDCFDKTVDKEGYIVEKNNPSQRVLTPDGEELKKDEWGAFKEGSEVFIKKDLLSLIDLADTVE